MIKEKIKENIFLAPLTTYRIGGPARYYLEIKEKNDIEEAFAWAKKEKIKVYILGGVATL